MLFKIEMEVDNMERQTLSNRLRTAYWSLVALGCGLMLSVQPVLAETIWDRFSSIMQDIYGQVVAISPIVAAPVAAIALIVRMVSRNQRAVDEATSWLKRIVVTWIVLNTLGFIVAYLQPLIAGGQYTGGLIGGNSAYSSPTVKRCYAVCDVTSTTSDFGALFGRTN